MFSDLAYLLINTFFYFAILVVFLRLLFQLIKADYNNPISQFVLKVTGPVLIPMRRVIPPFGKIDSASLILILLLKIIQVSLITLIQYGSIFSLLYIIKSMVFGLTSMALNFYFFAIFGQIILSWVAPHNNNPALYLLHQITEPLMAPARRILPPISSMDFSPVIVLLGIKILEVLLLHPNGTLNTLFNAFATLF